MADNGNNGGNLAVIATTIESAKTRFLQATGGSVGCDDEAGERDWEG